MLSVAPAALAAELSETGEFVDGVAAIVNDGVVLKSQLRDQTAIVIERAARSNPPMQLPQPDVLRDQLLESLIVKEIQLQRAELIGLQVSDAMLNQAIEQLAMQQGIRFEDMPALLCRFLPDGTLTFVNTEYAAYFAREPADLVAAPWTGRVIFACAWAGLLRGADLRVRSLAGHVPLDGGRLPLVLQVEGAVEMRGGIDVVGRYVLDQRAFGLLDVTDIVDNPDDTLGEVRR